MCMHAFDLFIIRVELTVQSGANNFFEFDYYFLIGILITFSLEISDFYCMKWL